MGQFEDDVRELIRDDYRSLAGFARAVGVPEHTLYSALANGLANTTFSTLAPIVKGLNITFDEVLKGELAPEATEEQASSAPLLDAKDLDRNRGDGHTSALRTYPVPSSVLSKHPHAFFLRMQDNSMNRLFRKGSYVLVDPNLPCVESGAPYALVVGEGHTTIKIVLLHDNGLTLQPNSDDPTYQSKLFINDDHTAQPVHSIGRVVWSCGYA